MRLRYILYQFMKIPNLRKKRRDRKRRFSFVLIFNIFLTVCFILLAYFHLVSHIGLLIYILSLLVVEFLISYKILVPDSIKDYLIICFTEKKDGKNLPNANFISLLGTIILPLLSSITILKKEQLITEQFTKEQTINIINNKSNDIESLLKINEKYLTQDLENIYMSLDISSIVFYFLFNYNEKIIKQLSRHPIYEPLTTEYLQNKLNINNELEANVIKNLFHTLLILNKKSSYSTINGLAENYSSTLNSYDITLKTLGEEIYSKKEIYLKNIKSDFTFYLVYNILLDDDERERFASIMPTEYSNTLYVSTLSYLYLYSKSDKILNYTFKLYRPKKHDFPYSSRSSIENLVFSIKEYILNYEKSLNYLIFYMKEKFKISIILPTEIK